MSKRHPGRQDLRAVMILLLVPPALGWRAYEEFLAGETTAALGFSVGLLAMVAISGFWLWSRYGHREAAPEAG